MEHSFGIAKTRVTPPPISFEVSNPLEFEQSRFLQLVAGAGYGKSTLLVDLMARSQEPAYALLTPFETDQYQVVLLMAAAFGQVVDIPVDFSTDTSWRPMADALINHLPDRALDLIIDDLHHLVDKPGAEALDYLLRFLPRSYRFVLAGRALPQLPSLRKARIRGEAKLLTAQELRLSSAELLRLCEGDQAQAEQLEELTDGWPMACAYLQKQGSDSWGEGKDDLEELILEDIWDRLEPSLREFLTLCSVLDFLTAADCDRLCGRADSKELLREFAREGVFVSRQSDGLRLHPLVREYLSRQLEANPALRERAYRGRSKMLLEQDRLVEAVPLLVALKEYERAAELIKQQAPALLRKGRQGILIKATAALTTESDATLLWFQAEAHRQDHQFERALELYRQAEQLASLSHNSVLEANCLTGRAQIFIDTVCPAEASNLLHRAYRVLPSDAGQAKADVMNLLAENAVNEGRARASQRYSRLASRLSGRPSGTRTEARLLLRTGRLRQAWEMTERSLAGELEGPGAAHRDEHLVLSYLASLQGQPDLAAHHAKRGLELAQEKHSSLTEAVATIRLAHAQSLTEKPDLKAVTETYARARELARAAAVPRLEAEILMGEALLFAAQGATADSYQAATSAVELTEQAGDAWLSAWIRLVLGIAAHTGKHPEALNLLSQARTEMDRCKDQFGQRVASLWLALAGSGDLEAWSRHAAERGQDFLLQRPTLFGPRQPLETESKANLHICALGPLRVFRNGHELSPKDFKRRKARELLALFLAQAETPCPRDQLMEMLWPEATRKAALRDFRVALHALSDALEPERPKKTTASCIERREEVYSFTLQDVQYEVKEFERLVALGNAESDPGPFWESALKLYKGDFLEDYPYLEWCAPHRERLRQLYLETAERLAHLHLDQEKFEAASDLAHDMLKRDRCWEEAYRILMRSHLSSERSFLAARVYDQCAEVLQSELGVPPSDETEELLALAT